MPSDIRTKAIVLRRTNYGESDRILNLLTPEGKMAVLARGVRKEKSHLAGGIELFSVADIVVHQGRSSLGTLTSAKMLHFYQNILADLPSLEFASYAMKKLEYASEQADNPEHFDLLWQVLAGLNQKYSLDLISIWFNFNLARTTGEEINLIRDISGDALSPDLTYSWDNLESALRPDHNGLIGVDEIKFARLLWGAKLRVVASVEDFARVLPKLSGLVAH